MTQLVLGIDGGGTKTDLLVCDKDGNEVARARTGSTSPKAVAPETARENMLRGAQALAEAGADLGALGACVYGLGGMDLPEERPFFAQMIADAGLPAPDGAKAEAAGAQDAVAHLTNDGLLPLYAAGVSAGSVIIAGTGSIAFHVAEDGSVARAGGWGYGVSDLGSGNWMGTAALQQALLVYDDATMPDGILADVVELAGLSSADELPRWAAAEQDGSTLASLAPAALNGTSRAALRIHDQAADHLASLYRGLVGKHPEAATQPVILAGGLFSSTRMLDAVSVRCLRVAGRSGGQPEIRRCVQPPVEGAVRLACALLAGTQAPPAEYPPRP